MNPDVVIIGGGIVGCSCAYFLARLGVKVRLVERGPLGSGTSRAGMMHVVTWEEPQAHLDLAWASKLLYEELDAALPGQLQFRRTGSIAVIENPKSVADFASSLGRLQARGLHCRMLTPQELLDLEPNLSPDVAGGALFEDDAQVNPLFATLAIARAAQALGAVLDPFTEVTGFETNPAKTVITGVITSRGTIHTAAAVIAAGPWSQAVGRLAGLDIPIRPRKGTLVVTSPVPDDFMHCKVILSAGYMDTVRAGEESGAAVAANIQQALNGNLLLGSSRQYAGFDSSVDPRLASRVLESCLRIFPRLATVQVIRIWTGFRPSTPDNLPIISPVESLGGLYIAAGHEGIGITEGPITGKLISQMITDQPPAVPLEALSFARFAGLKLSV